MMSFWQQKKNIRSLIGILLLISMFTLGGLLIWQDTQTAHALTLKSGSQGQAVRDVQQKLKNWGYYSGSVDGVFGQATRQAVIKFQKKNGLTADGVVGNNTLKALGLNKYVGTGGAGSSGSSNYNSDNVTLLARAIHAEAEGEPYIGKVAVGAVLLNRINSPDFPNTLSGVVYQSLALESVSNGRFNDQANQDSLRAAREALGGYDPTYGCLYFWNPETATSAWIWTRKIVVRYGKHVFGI
ncbi:MAG: spore cortex-lytic enzyme [Bacillota bacterium]|jgi:N-acetylmuramoyl-L-alanine amidase